MDEFFTELGGQLDIMRNRTEENKKITSRILDAKDCILAGEPVAEPDSALISRMLDDVIKIHCIIQDNKESFNKFMQMYF